MGIVDAAQVTTQQLGLMMAGTPRDEVRDQMGDAFAVIR